jgi:DNA-binding MarR family transcriptional regulator
VLLQVAFSTGALSSYVSAAGPGNPRARDIGCGGATRGAVGQAPVPARRESAPSRPRGRRPFFSIVSLPNGIVSPSWKEFVIVDPIVAEQASPVGTDTETIEELSHLMPALWRTLMRATRSSQRLPVVESQVSILRKLVAVGPMASARLAEELHLARPTVSNLIKDMEAAGIVERGPSETDGRSVMVFATAEGRERLQAFRRGRAEVLREAMSELGRRDRQRIVDVLPALEALLRELEEKAGDAPM